MSEEKQLTVKNELQDKILNSDEPVKDLTYLFNEYQIKESMLRTQHLSDLQNKVISKIDDRITKKPDNFTNMELVNTLNVIQSAKEKETTYVNTLNEKPQVQFVSNNLNVTVKEEFDQASRDKIMSAVADILKIAQQSRQEPVEILAEDATVE